MMKAKTFANVWDALEDSPEDAATMTMRSDVMAIIAATVRGWSTTEAEAARRLGLTPAAPRRPTAGKDQQVLARHAFDFGEAGRASSQDR